MVYHGSYPHRDDVKSWDPATAYDEISLDVVPSVYETLFQYSYLADTYKPVPLLAADMPKYTKDRLTVIIPLKRGVRFQDDPAFKETNGKGRELKAQDFVYALKRLALPALQSPGWWILDGKVAGINDFHQKLVDTPKGDISKVFGDKVAGIHALDDFTLQIKLTKPYPQLLHVLSMSFTAPVAAEAVAAYGDEDGSIAENPVGTGPFVLKTWQKGKRIVMERNPNYHADFYPSEGAVEFRKKGLLADAGKPLPFLDRIAIDVVKDPQASWLSFMKGKHDMIAVPSESFEQAIKEDAGGAASVAPELATKGIRLTTETGGNFSYVSFNMRDPILGHNRYLRQAISSAIDRGKWMDILAHKGGKKANSALPPGVQDRPAGAKLKFDYNANYAKELMKKAGYPEGKGLAMLNFDMRGADAMNRQLGEFFKQQLAAIGIKANVIYNTFPAFIDKMRRGDLQLSYGAWTLDYPDAENVFQLLYGPNKAPGPNDSSFNNAQFNEMYEELSKTEDSSARQALIKKMEDLVQEEVPWALGFYQAQHILTQAWMLNYRADQLINNKYKYIRVNRDVKRRYMEAK